MSSPRGGSLSRPAVFLAAQAALLVGAAWLLLARDCGTPALPRRLLPWAASGGGGGNASGGSSGTRGSSGNASGSGSSLPAPAAELFQHTSALQEWVAAPDRLSFLAPQSRCLLDPRGAVETERWRSLGATPFLFDTASMPSVNESCSHCPPDEYKEMPYCCGVCVFSYRKCDDFYPGENKAETALERLLGEGLRLHDFSPCELFARIRGRTLWVMGDSQTWNVYYALECLMREFAPDLQRRPAVQPEAANEALVTVRGPVPYRPVCLHLALGTRVCGVRVDAIKHIRDLIFTTLAAKSSTFSQDIVVFNFGLHYPPPGADGGAANASLLWAALSALGDWREENRATLPQMVWMDTPVQHFSTPDGAWPGGAKPYTCAPLAAWYDGNAFVRAGGAFNAPIAPLVPRIADAHLKTWNATVSLWDSHWPEECSHWCHPGAYQVWLFLLNDLLRDSRLGLPVYTPDRAA